MLVRNTATRLAIAGVSALALAATAVPAMAGDVSKPAQAPSGVVHNPTATDITQQTLEGDAGGKDKYEYSNEIIYWSVTAVKPGAGTKKADLALYEDKRNRVKVAQSKEKKKKIDFVVVDSNHAAVPATWYPTVTSKGGGTYTIQNDSDNDLLGCPGTIDAVIAPGGLVDIIDTIPWSDDEWTFSVSGGAEAFLFTSNSEDPDSWHQGRSEGAKLPVTLAGDSDWRGLVVADSSGDGGTFTVTCS